MQLLPNPCIIHFIRGCTKLDRLLCFDPSVSPPMGLLSLYDNFVRRTYLSAGLRPCSVAVDAETTIHCWLPPHLVPKTGGNGGSSEDGCKPSDTSPDHDIASAKPLLLLIHGFGPRGTWQWRQQVRPLAARFDVVVPDLIFFGASTTSSPLRSEAFQAAAFGRLLDLLLPAASAGRPKATVVGTSYGGFVAYHMARMLGEERVGQVVIASSNVLKMPEDDRKFAERTGVESPIDVMLPRSTDNLRKLCRIITYRQLPFLPDFILRAVLKNIFQENIEEKLELLKGITLGKKDEFQLTPLPQKVLIIWGEEDQVFPVDRAVELQKHLGEKAKLVVLKRAGHLPQIEDSQQFNDALLKFLLDAPGSKNESIDQYGVSRRNITNYMLLGMLFLVCVMFVIVKYT